MTVAGPDASFLVWIDTSTAPLRMAAAAVLPVGRLTCGVVDRGRDGAVVVRRSLRMVSDRGASTC
jgi:hypothetical protein